MQRCEELGLLVPPPGTQRAGGSDSPLRPLVLVPLFSLDIRNMLIRGKEVILPSADSAAVFIILKEQRSCWTLMFPRVYGTTAVKSALYSVSSSVF